MLKRRRLLWLQRRGPPPPARLVEGAGEPIVFIHTPDLVNPLFPREPLNAEDVCGLSGGADAILLGLDRVSTKAVAEHADVAELCEGSSTRAPPPAEPPGRIGRGEGTRCRDRVEVVRRQVEPRCWRTRRGGRVHAVRMGRGRVEEEGACVYMRCRRVFGR
ncbi:hypothetical protein PR202_gb07236 [Eleusine coracana subsp. coracana]|uniref:Uncharacterized protein n=1 Tax=Eleusine coracana subsp. coracana TaxID=191504 RepID=A0AAV5EBR4_ELECO|nr:hypothetical protein PR202_gb07236 [Eleusine coracana subsp. coracana]